MSFHLVEKMILERSFFQKNLQHHCVFPITLNVAITVDLYLNQLSKSKQTQTLPALKQ